MTSRRRKGFSLIETLVAIGLAAVGFAAILEIYPRAFAASAKSQSRAVATSIATDILSQFRRQLPANNRTYVRKMRSGATWTNDYNLVGITGDSSYFYQVWVEDVTDPFKKYMIIPALGTDQPYNGTNVAGTTARDYKTRQLWRVTAYVRGPFATTAEALTWGGVAKTRQAHVQVCFTTLVADRELGATILLRDAAPGNTRIYVANLDHFTCFNVNRLGTSWNSVEIADTGPMVGATWQCNYLTLDNVFIGDSLDVNAIINTPGSIAGAGESNKIIDMGYEATTTGAPALAWGCYLQLLRPIRGKWSTASSGWVSYTGYLTNPSAADLVNSLVAVQKSQ